MYKISSEIKRIIKFSLIIASIIEIILLIINWKYGLTFLIGYFVSILVLLKNNYFITNALYNVSSPKKTLNLNYFYSLVIYFIALFISFLIGVIPGLFCGLGLIIIKITIVILEIFTKAGD